VRSCTGWRWVPDLPIWTGHSRLMKISIWAGDDLMEEVTLDPDRTFSRDWPVTYTADRYRWAVDAPGGVSGSVQFFWTD